MKCHTLFSGKRKKNIVNLWSAELAQRVVKVKHLWLMSLLYYICYFRICISFLSLSVALHNTIPFIGFGFLDNLLMIVAVSIYLLCLHAMLSKDKMVIS